MNKHDFYYCCGAVEVGAFGWDDDPVQEKALEGILSQARSESNKGFAICTTVKPQTAAVKRLKASKFRVLATFKNPNTGNEVTLWGRET